MHKALRYGFASLSLLGFGVMAIPTSEARSVPPFLGQAQNPNDAACFSHNSAILPTNKGAIVNTCPTTRQFCVALPVDSAGHQILDSVVAFDSAHNISCFGQAVDIFGRAQGFAPAMSPPTFNQFFQLGLMPLSVPNSGGLYTCCDISGGNSAAFVTINW